MKKQELEQTLYNLNYQFILDTLDWMNEKLEPYGVYFEAEMDGYNMIRLDFHKD